MRIPTLDNCQSCPVSLSTPPQVTNSKNEYHFKMLNFLSIFFSFFSCEEQPKTLLIDEVEKGKKYELVLTLKSGFYRYRFGDVIEVVGHHENCPVVEVCYR